MGEPSASLGVYFQPACLQHRYIRHADSSHIFERPERLRAVMVGVAAAVARCEASPNPSSIVATLSNERSGLETPPISTAQDDLSSLLDNLSLQTPAKDLRRKAFHPTSIIDVVTPPSLPVVPGNILLHNAAVNLSHIPPPEAPFQPLASASSSHPDIGQSPYLKDLVKWANEAPERIRATGCEIPEGLDLNPGDLYLSPGSIVAMEGAVQSVCQAVTNVCKSVGRPSAPVQPTAGPSVPSLHKRAFCAIRPPGHHCGEDEPSGFCYINNVVVGAMHAYLTEDIDRAVILDFDLHHGNGTQSLVMPFNAASHADDLQLAAGKPPTRDTQGEIRRSWKGFYGSVHDIWSYPCEDGDLDLIRNASVSLASHGQYIENVHLQPYGSEQDFYAHNYPKYLALLERASTFLRETRASPGKTMVFVSAGFDACEHEHQGMQRHDRRVPASFFARYTNDIIAFADKFAGGKVVSVLEGGYGDRALSSGTMGHVCGLMGRDWSDKWWSEQELIKLEKATKRRRNGKLAPLPVELVSDSYLQRIHSLVSNWEDTGSASTTTSAVPSPAGQASGRMTLRERQKAPAGHYADTYELDTPVRRPAKAPVNREQLEAVKGQGRAPSSPSVASADRDSAKGARLQLQKLVGVSVKHEQEVSAAVSAVQTLSLGQTLKPIVPTTATAQGGIKTPASAAQVSSDAQKPSETCSSSQAPPRIILKFSRPPQDS